MCSRFYAKLQAKLTHYIEKIILHIVSTIIAKTTNVPKTGKSKNVIIPLNCSISLVSLFII